MARFFTYIELNSFMSAAIIRPTVGVCVLTLNAGKLWCEWIARTTPAVLGWRLLVIDSSSTDHTVETARQAGHEVIVIQRDVFDHGGTRQKAIDTLSDCEIVVFLTQDALVTDTHTLSQLVAAFDDPKVGAAYGRQLPHTDATPIAAHARYFNYPDTSYVVSQEDVPQRGIKTAFLSNSFAAYRRSALLNAGGFPTNTILSEDMIAGARLLKDGWKLAYVAHACVRHSHNYTPWEEFKRYFDIGVLHHRDAWLLAWLGKAEGEGARFVRSEARYLAFKAPWRLPEVGLRTLLKYAGYRLGRLEAYLPRALKRRLSMHRGYWR